jgi:hypothetical protein
VGRAVVAAPRYLPVVQNLNRLNVNRLNLNCLSFDSLNLDLPEHRKSGTSLSANRKDDRASAGTVIPADANQGVSTFLI